MLNLLENHRLVRYRLQAAPVHLYRIYVGYGYTVLFRPFMYRFLEDAQLGRGIRRLVSLVVRTDRY